MKRKSSIIVTLTLLLVNCPEYTSAGQLYDTIVGPPYALIHQKTVNQAVSEPDLLQTDKIKRSAEEVVKMVLQHLPGSEPSSFNHYSAITFNRFRISNRMPLKIVGITADTMEDTVNKPIINYLFSNESLTFQKLQKSGIKHSEILSSKSEGKDDGYFSKLDSILNDMSLLHSTVEILNRGYLSPFSVATFSNFDFTSIDSVSASGDSLYNIRFIPKSGNSFDGFTGTAVIGTKDFAIHQINARSTPSNPLEPVLFINQLFAPLKGYWLPSEKKINLFFHRINAERKEINLLAESLINIYEPQIDPPLSAYDFKGPLPRLLSDSAIIPDNPNQKTKMIRFFAEGKIPMGYFTLDYNRIIGYNLFEGIKLGLGGETNRLLSKHFTVGGYISYGLKDQSLRHSEWINFYPSGSSDLRIYLGYRDMNIELGEPEFLETKSLLNPESYRYLLIKNMFASKRYAVGIEYRPLKELNYYLFADLSENHSRLNTQFLKEHPFSPITLARTGLQLRYTPGIMLQMEDGRHKEMNVPKTDYYLTILQGHNIISGEYQYTKLEFKGKFNLLFSKLGTTTIVFRGGIMTQNSPIIELFNSYGSYAGTFSLAAPYSFATMQLNEFAAARYTAIHLRHDFSRWLFPEKFKTRPAFIFAQNIGTGQLNDQFLEKYNMADYRKGFYESGFEVNNLLRMNYLSFGAGIYYRYGPYRFSYISDNFAYKFGFLFKL